MAIKNLGLSRRNIVKAVTIVPFSAVVGSTANSAVTVGLIGSGNRGPGLARFAEQDKRGRVVALSDLFDEKIELGHGTSKGGATCRHRSRRARQRQSE